jgi:single-stranded DNA-binding protein
MSLSCPQNHLCSVTLLGNLVNTPTIRYQANPVVAVAEFTLATHSQWFDKTSKQKKEWTSYHTIKMIGDVVERTLLHAQKGDITLIQGYLVDSKKSSREIIHATYAQPYAKGYARSINQIHCTGQLSSAIKLVTTEQEKILAEFTLTIDSYCFTPLHHELKRHTITRNIHVWGSQAKYIAEHAKLGDQFIIEGKLNYAHHERQSQYLDAQQAILLKQ